MSIARSPPDEIYHCLILTLLSSILNGALVKDAFRLGMSVTKAVDQNTDTDKPEQLDGIIERSDNGANFADAGDIVIAHVCKS